MKSVADTLKPSISHLHLTPGSAGDFLFCMSSSYPEEIRPFDIPSAGRYISGTHLHDGSWAIGPLLRTPYRFFRSSARHNDSLAASREADYFCMTHGSKGSMQESVRNDSTVSEN
jgi:hypothetical protein